MNSDAHSTHKEVEAVETIPMKPLEINTVTQVSQVLSNCPTYASTKNGYRHIMIT